MSATKHTLQALPLLLLFAQQAAASSGCNSTTATDGADKQGAINLKLFIAPILTAGAAGVLVPVLGRSMAALRPNGDIFFVVKAFAARVILVTSRVHILPAAFDSLTSPYLQKGGGGRNGFHFAGLVAMCFAMATMVIDSLAAGYYRLMSVRHSLLTASTYMSILGTKKGGRQGMYLRTCLQHMARQWSSAHQRRLQ